MTTRRIFSFFAAVLLTALPAVLQGGGSSETRMRTQLAGARINNMSPSGHADFRASSGRARLNVQVEDVNIAVGSVLDVYLDGQKIGSLSVAAVVLGGELELNTQDGDMVPTVSKGSWVLVKHGDRAVAAGVF